MENVLYSFSGNASDLLVDEGKLKMTSLVEIDDENGSDVRLAIESFNEKGIHEVFDRMLGRNIEITVRIIE